MRRRAAFYFSVYAVGLTVVNMSGEWHDYAIAGLGLGMLVYIFLQTVYELEEKE